MLITLFCYYLMSERLKKVEKQLSKKPWDYFGLKNLLSEQHRALLTRIEQFGRAQLTTQKLIDHRENAIFPNYLIPKLQQLQLGKYFIPKPYGQQLPLLVQGAIIATIAQFDLGVSTFLFLQLPLSGRTIYQLGSQEQKEKYMKDIIELKKIFGWALTERDVGSNSTRLGTSFTKNGDHFLLNGNKRWIGNADKDYIIAYGKINQAEGKSRIISAIVNIHDKGVTSIPIKHKIPFRIVQNCQIQFDNVKIEQSCLLPKSTNYKQGVERVLKHSRIIVIWNAVGGCIGVYNSALSYSLNRYQFGRPIAGFQLTQQKLVRMMGYVQAMLLLAWRLTELYDLDNNLETGKVGMFKAWITERARLVCMLGRQILGGNGLLQQNHVMQALVDMEVLYTYQGTYDINSLVAGSQITGLKAFM